LVALLVTDARAVCCCPTFPVFGKGPQFDFEAIVFFLSYLNAVQCKHVLSLPILCLFCKKFRKSKLTILILYVLLQLAPAISELATGDISLDEFNADTTPAAITSSLEKTTLPGAVVPETGMVECTLIHI
jgi:hypothetical protein